MAVRCSTSQSRCYPLCRFNLILPNARSPLLQRVGFPTDRISWRGGDNERPLGQTKTRTQPAEIRQETLGHQQAGATRRSPAIRLRVLGLSCKDNPIPKQWVAFCPRPQSYRAEGRLPNPASLFSDSQSGSPRSAPHEADDIFHGLHGFAGDFPRAGRAVGEDRIDHHRVAQ
jgi:hypothetical protein